MKCTITGVDTNNKWRGYPLCKEILDLAKLMEDEVGFTNISFRQRLIKLSDRWAERKAEELAAARKERNEAKIND